MKISKEITNIAKNIKLVIFDVDGVLTDGGIYFSDDGFSVELPNKLLKILTQESDRLWYTLDDFIHVTSLKSLQTFIWLYLMNFKNFPNLVTYNL